MSDSFTRAAYSYQEEVMFLRNAEVADSELNHANYNEKDAMLIVIQNLISENLELKRRLNLHENKCSVQAPAESHAVGAGRRNETAEEYKLNINWCRSKSRKEISTGACRSCSYCGEYHRSGKQNCLAYGKTCKRCCKLNHIDKVCRSRTESLKRCKSLPSKIEKQPDSERRTTEKSSDENVLKQKKQNGSKIKPSVRYASVCKKQEKTYTMEKVAKDVLNLKKKQMEMKELELKVAKIPLVRMKITKLGNEISSKHRR